MRQPAVVAVLLLTCPFWLSACADSRVTEIERWATSPAYDGQTRRNLAHRIRYDHPSQLTIEVLERLCRDATGREERARVLSAALAYAEALFGFPRIEPFAQIARESLFDPDPRISEESARLLALCGTPEDTALLAERVRSATDSKLLEALFWGLAERRCSEVIRTLMAEPMPAPADTDALQTWRTRCRIAMQAVLVAYCIKEEELRDFGPRLVNAAQKDPALAGQAVYVMALFRAEGVLPDIRAAFESVGEPRGKVPLAAALIAFGEEPSGLAAEYLDHFEDATKLYSGDADNWEAVALLARWLGFAAALRPDWHLLTEVWDACQALKARDRAELLALIADNFVNFNMNPFLYLISRLPSEELGRMMRLEPRLACVMCILIGKWHMRELPKGIDKLSMHRAVLKIREAMPLRHRPQVREYFGPCQSFSFSTAYLQDGD